MRNILIELSHTAKELLKLTRNDESRVKEHTVVAIGGVLLMRIWITGERSKSHG